MMDIASNSKDERVARIVAFIFTILLLFFILYPFWSYTFPPPEQEGILVSFGSLEEVDGSEKAEVTDSKEEKPSDTGELQERDSQNASDIATQNTRNSQSTPVETKILSEEESPIIKKESIEQAKEVAKVSQEEIEARKAAEEREEQLAFEETKRQFGDLINKGGGKTSSTQERGDPEGEPSIDNLSSLIAGKGKVEGGLADRGLLFEPEIDENSQKSGKVVVKVCANQRGEVTEANYTQRGSTTTDIELVNVAVEGAKKYRFSRSPIEKQCGTITIEFKLK